MMPKRLIANEKAKIQLIRQCPNDVAVTLTTIELRGKGNTFLKFDTPPSTATSLVLLKSGGGVHGITQLLWTRQSAAA